MIVSNCHEHRIITQHHFHCGNSHIVQDDEIVDGFFDDYGDAVRAGLKNFGVQRPFLVKQVWITEPVYFV